MKVNNILKSCTLCPRKCGADRAGGKYGFCGAGNDIRIARAALHFWEEPCISGESGSGTVFFSNCTMKCLYCQNYEVSTNNFGYEVSVDELTDIFLNLQKQGANNINLVTPTHYIPQIISALDKAKEKGLILPVVYNTGGYERVETIKLLKGYVDIYMPDFKYYNDDIALKLSRAPRYREYAEAAIDEMYKQVGKPIFNESGIMQKGVIIRHLMLPGFLRDSIKIIDCISEKYGNNVFFSLMSQYTPLRNIDEFKSLNNKLNFKYYNFAVDRCVENGMKNVFIQEGEAADESFIPEFSSDHSTLCL